jgi:hypothetical protein
MIKNSPSRLTKRRKAAQLRRSVNLANYEVKLAANPETHPDNKVLESKIEIAKTDLTNLNKKVSQFA